MEVSDVHRFRAAESAVWPVRRSGTAAPRAGCWDWRTRGQSDRRGVPTNETWNVQSRSRHSELELRGPRNGFEIDPRI
eukprot:9418390-Alexandrium_andersonii.AAC.1